MSINNDHLSVYVCLIFLRYRQLNICARLLYAIVFPWSLKLNIPAPNVEPCVLSSVHPMKHAFCALACLVVIKYWSSTTSSVAALTPQWSYYCPNASEATQNDMEKQTKLFHQERWYNHNERSTATLCTEIPSFFLHFCHWLPITPLQGGLPFLSSVPDVGNICLVWNGCTCDIVSAFVRLPDVFLSTGCLFEKRIEQVAMYLLCIRFT